MEFLKKFMQNKEKNTKWFILAGVIAAVVLMIAIPGIIMVSNFNFRVIAEAGEEFDQGLLWKGGFSLPTTMEEKVNTDEIGTGDCLVKVLGFIPMKVTVEVRDRIEPTLLTKDLVIAYGDECKPEDFVLECQDASGVVFEFVTMPDTKQTGNQTVSITAKDAYGNSATRTAVLMVKSIIASHKMELGAVVPDASVFVVDKNIEVSYVTAPDAELLKKVGKYPVQLLVQGVTENVEIEVVDTVAPVVEVSDKSGFVNKTFAPESFVTSIVDFSDTTVSFKTEPDLTKEGAQSVVIVVTDVAGNAVEKEANLTLVKDTIAPSIGTSYIKVAVNGTLSYKKSISVVDNCDSSAEIILDIDNSAVNLSAVGSYVVHCTAKDTSGNTTSCDITVQVVDASTEIHTLEEINAYADKILAQIINDSMTPREKAYEIYKWTRSNIGYLNNSPKGDWMQGAYDGMVKRAGDCFTYAATAKALLERIGLAPIVITKEVTPGTSPNNHYWLLLDLGEGYYHYDPTRRADGTWFFMWTDAQIMDYSNNHWGSHNFTRSKYPPIVERE